MRPIIASIIKQTISNLFGGHLDFRARLFNIMAVAGILISLFTAVMGVIIGAGLANLLFCLLAMALAVFLIRYSYVSGRYQRSCMITIICVFLGLFPALFFSTGGYHSGMPSFFIFAVLFTVFMLDGKKMAVMTFLELALYSTLCIFAYYNPDKISFFNTEKDILLDIMFGFLSVSVALGVTMTLHLRLYKQRQTELEAARKQVEEYSNMKGELFTGMSHEIRTPLTGISLYAQFVVKEIRESGLNEETLADLAAISGEANRLAELADNTAKILMGTFDKADFLSREESLVDICDITLRLVRLLNPVAVRNGIKLTAEIKANVPAIPGYANILTQLVWNILQNAITHSNAKAVELSVEADAGNVKITVNDDGTGVESDILPRIFERGVSGRKGGSGIGLAICREIAEQHNGKITIKSEGGAGTSVTVILRGIA
jgi:signal transduction histidine kinase